MALSSSAGYGMGLGNRAAALGGVVCGSLRLCSSRGSFGLVGLRQSSRSLFGMSLGDFLPSNGSRFMAATWLDNSAQVDVDVPLSIAWDLWSDRERINRWMPWISSVKVLEDQPELSRWTLSTDALGQKVEFSWLARNLEPIHHQKIHWRSEDGLPNRGAVRFYPRGPSDCRVQLTISYEIPEILGVVASALSPVVEGMLKADLDRFAKLAREEALQAKKG